MKQWAQRNPTLPILLCGECVGDLFLDFSTTKISNNSDRKKQWRELSFDASYGRDNRVGYLSGTLQGKSEYLVTFFDG
jgi:hypothetical protein